MLTLRLELTAIERRRRQ